MHTKNKLKMLRMFVWNHEGSKILMTNLSFVKLTTHWRGVIIKISTWTTYSNVQGCLIVEIGSVKS